MSKDSLAVAIEALSWIAYTGIGERAALLKASEEIGINDSRTLRDAHKWVMETSRFQNQLDWGILQVVPSETFEGMPHGIRSLFRVIAYTKHVQTRPLADLQRMAGWGRQVIGWRELQEYEEQLARIITTTRIASTACLPESERLAIETCHPAWYVERVILRFGRPTGLRILERDLSPVATFARTNELKERSSNLVVEKLQASTVSGLDGVLILDRNSGISARGNFAASGKIVIQDLASIVAGLVASPRPGQLVLDLCASPGNKTSHLAAQMHNEGNIYSVELSQTRSRQWRNEMARTGCSIATLIRADSAQLPLHDQVDVALVDPPCSNSGVFARNPASKWRISFPRMQELVRAQAKMLQAGSERLRNGGTLVYCTCSVLPEEDEFIVETFLKKNTDFTLVQQEPFLGCGGLRGLSYCQRFYPHLHNCNGYFIAKMRKG